MSKSAAPWKEIFLRTLHRLDPQEREDVCGEFVQEMSGGMGLHFFPLFVRQKKMDLAICELAQIEWILYQLSQVSAPSKVLHFEEAVDKNKKLSYKINSLAHWLYLSFAVQEFSLSPGLWGFTAAKGAPGVLIRELNAHQARILDIISEGILIDSETLIEVSIEQSGAEAPTILQARQNIADLVDWRILFCA